MDSNSTSSYLFVRGLRQVSHTVFSVQDGQKTYYDPQFNRKVAYSSGQQVKRSVLDALSDALSEPRAPITFNKKLTADDVLKSGEPWSPCDPQYADQLLGGWMRAESGGGNTLKRRSPLSVSAMRPLHPLLSSLASESASFDRTENPENHPVRVVNADGEEMSDEEIQEFLDSNNRTLPRRKWIPPEQVGPRAHGLFVFDIAIDLPRLFSVSTNQHEPELGAEKIERLKDDGWVETDKGRHLICPRDRREEIIEAFAHGLVNWRVTSNQSRTFSPQPTLALAFSDNANRVTGSIRADLNDDVRNLSATPVIDHIDGVDLFVALACKGHIPGVTASADALDRAEQHLIEQLGAFDYEAAL